MISLGGSYVPDDWKRQPGTEYVDIRYEGNILNNLQSLDGLNAIYGKSIFDPIRLESPDPGETSFDQHGRLGGGETTNLPVLESVFDILKDGQ